jgi:hypothetical protein
MVTQIDHIRLPIEKRREIEHAIFENGYYSFEYVWPEKTIETQLRCPVCGTYLSLYQCGDSHEITCKTIGCIRITARGI